MSHHNHKKETHKLKIYHYKSGSLDIEEFFFESLEDAKDHSKHHKGKIRKIFDEFEELIHSCDDDDNETYA